MTINIQHIKMPISESMNEFVEKKLQKIADKYNWLIRVDVSFKLEKDVSGKGNICEMELSYPGPKIFTISKEETFEGAAKQTIADLEK